MNPTPMITFSMGLHLALNQAILQACLPGGGVMPALLDGTPKSLIAFWCGGQDGHPGTFQPERGDGRLLLKRPGDFLYFEPWFVPPDHNIRAGVPLWLLCNEPGQEPGPGAVLALGVLHPLFCSATVQTYHPETGEALDMLYLNDPRVEVNRHGRLKPLSEVSESRKHTQPNPMEWLTAGEQQSRLREMHGLPIELPPHAPQFQ